MAAAVSGANHPALAAKLSGADQAFHEDKGESQGRFDFGEFNRYIQAAKGQLDDRTFETLQNKGRQLNIKQAIALAMEINRSESEKQENSY